MQIGVALYVEHETQLIYEKINNTLQINMQLCITLQIASATVLPIEQ